MQEQYQKYTKGVCVCVSMIAAALVPLGTASAQTIEPIDYQRTPADIEPLDSFGSGVRLSRPSGYAIAGAFRHDVPNSNTTNSGAAYIYERFPDRFDEVQKLRADTPVDFEHFGTSVDMTTTVAVVSAPGATFGIGRVDVFRRNLFKPSGEQWEFEQSLVPPGGTIGDEFGGAEGAHEAIATDGSYIVVGARNAEAGNEDGAGKVYIWLYNSQQDEWEFDTTLTSDNPEEDAHFGHSVAIDGRYVIVGAPMSASANGAAYIFYRDDFGNWSLDQRLPGNVLSNVSPPGNRFGWSVAIDDIAVIGAPGAERAAIYRRLSQVPDPWQLEKTLSIVGSEPGDEFGHSVSTFKSFYNYTLVGAPNRAYPGKPNVKAGAAYLFNNSAGLQWDLDRMIIQYPELANHDDRFGAVVSTFGGEWAISAIGDSAPGSCQDDIGPTGACDKHYGAIYLKGDSPVPPCGEECVGDRCCACGPLFVTWTVACADEYMVCEGSVTCQWLLPLIKCENGVARWEDPQTGAWVELDLNADPEVVLRWAWDLTGLNCPCPVNVCETPVVCDDPLDRCDLYEEYGPEIDGICVPRFQFFCPLCACFDDPECVPCE